MMRVRGLFESALVRVERIDHPAGEPHVDPPREVSQQYSINFLERGEFSVEHGTRTLRVGATEIFVTIPGQALRYVHKEEVPDDVCVAVCFKDAVRDEIQRDLGSLSGHAPVLALSNRGAYLRHRLLDHLSSSADPVAVDLVAGELLTGTLEPGARRLYRPGQLAWYAARIDAARRRLDEEYASDHTLANLARDVGMSPFHFARVFHELAGSPPHRYLLRRRLTAAAERLRDGGSVTDTCYSVGFRSLSHFIHVFRRAFGVPPSRIGQRRTR